MVADFSANCTLRLCNRESFPTNNKKSKQPRKFSTANDLHYTVYMVDSLGSDLFRDSLSVNLPQHVDSDQSDNSSELAFNAITVPEISSPLNENDLNYLRVAIDPLRNSSNHGVDIYMDCIQTVFQLM